jgi:hypothetical protein
MQEFARFEVRENVDVSANDHGEYSYEQALQKIHGLENASAVAGVLSAVGISSVLLDISGPLIVNIRDNIALVTDFDWGDISKSQRQYKWLFVIFRLAVVFITGDVCGSPDCVCNLDLEFSPFITSGARFCKDCKRKIVNRGGVELMKLVEENFQRLRGLMASGCTLEYLNKLEAEQLINFCGQACELKVNELWIRQWLARELGSSEPITGQFPLLPSTICKWSFSRGLRPEWADIVLRIIENVRHVDTLLYLTKKRHRDHSRHQLYVAAIGLFFLNAKVIPAEPLQDVLIRILSQKYSDGKTKVTWDTDQLRQCWIVSALLHDSGYPISHMLEVAANMCHKEAAATSVDFDLIESVLHQSKFVADRWVDCVPSIKNQISTAAGTTYSEVAKSLLENLSSSFSHCFKSVSADGYIKGLPGGISTSLRKAASKNELIFDHGLWSAANLIELFRAEKWPFDRIEGNPANLSLIEAIEGVALHNISPDDYKIGFRQNPMACFLRFCDEIQEWNRGTLTSEGFLQETDHIILSPVTEIGGDVYVDREMKVRFEFTEGGKLVKSDWDLRKFIGPKRSLNIPDFPLSVSFEVSLPFRKGEIT